jgi:hypothetical protein
MKSLKYIIISLALLCSAVAAQACWNPWYLPHGYYLYRVYEPMTEVPSVADERNQVVVNNCQAWQKATSTTIPLEDIYHVVYTMDLAAFEAVYDHPKAEYENVFLQWITKKDRAILEFLYLAKTNEHLRVKHNSRWYYPTMKTGARMNLEEVAEKALKQTKAGRLRDRYMLQAVRALFSLGKYEQCIALWNAEISRLPQDNLMRQMILPYIAGAEFRMNHVDNAVTYFAEAGDVQSVLYCTGRSDKSLSRVEALEVVCQYAPNSHVITETLQECVRRMEPEGTYFGDIKFIPTSDYEKLYALSLKMANNAKVKNRPMWYYTAAFLADLNGKVAEADKLLRQAENYRTTAFLEGSIKVLRIYLDAKRSAYNAAYENKLLGQLKWLDTMIHNNLNTYVETATAQAWSLKNGQSYYYWNDMLRRILLAEVCPRMLKAGNEVRALQLANMADNLLLNLVDKQIVSSYEVDDHGDYIETDTLLTMDEYREYPVFNGFDYSNHFFELIDSIGLKTAERYVQRVQHPQGEFDRFTNARSYVSSDYLNDILGTQCLRNMRYRDALIYLGKVSETYFYHLNTYMDYNPFSLEPKRIKDKEFKYDFAREMYALEQSMALTEDPNRKAQLLVKYAIGIKNSFDLCWGLTQYYFGTTFWGSVCEKRDWINDKFTLAANKKVTSLVAQADQIATDKELAAEIQYMFCNYKTIARKYPNTQRGRLVRGQCDNLYDHHAESKRYKSQWKWPEWYE